MSMQSRGEQLPCAAGHGQDDGQTGRRLYAVLAEVLDYPTRQLAARVKESLSLLPAGAAGPAELLDDFLDHCRRASDAALEELYTATFDLQPRCSLHVGYHLFGEDWRRNELLAELARHYRAHGFAAGRELPDHLCVMLRYLAHSEPHSEEAEAMVECLVPALERMAAQLERQNPYGAVLGSLLLCLQAEHPTALLPGSGGRGEQMGSAPPSPSPSPSSSPGECGARTGHAPAGAG